MSSLGIRDTGPFFFFFFFFLIGVPLIQKYFIQCYAVVAGNTSQFPSYLSEVGRELTSNIIIHKILYIVEPKSSYEYHFSSSISYGTVLFDLNWINSVQQLTSYTELFLQ